MTQKPFLKKTAKAKLSMLELLMRKPEGRMGPFVVTLKKNAFSKDYMEDMLFIRDE